MFVKGKMKKQRKLINTEERTTRKKQIGHMCGRESSVLNREVCFLFVVITVLGSHKTFAYSLMHLLSPPSPTTYLLSIPFLKWLEFISLPTSGGSNTIVAVGCFPLHPGLRRLWGPSTQYSFCGDFDLLHKVSHF